MTTPPDDDYFLGRSDHETRRLINQHKIYGPITRHWLESAGITAGMRVLDLGSGAGDVALLVADLVGPQGRVVGVDQNPTILQRARIRAEVAGWSTVEFHHGDVENLPSVGEFDAVVGRWILMYQPDPAAVLRRCRERLRPGGILAFQESDLIAGTRPYPDGPLHDQVLAWLRPTAGGPELRMGMKLFETYVRAGLPEPQLRLEGPIGGGVDWPGYQYVADTLHSLLPFLERSGVVDPAEVDIDTIADRLRDELTGRTGVQILPPVVGAWARTPATAGHA
jgi:SAM-dependent methyltransferase